MELRKKIRLKDYDYSTAGWYSVTVCVKERRQILGSVVGADLLSGPKVCLTELGASVEKVLLSMPAVERYVIMPNHVHMILRVESGAAELLGTSAPTASVPDQVRYFKNAVTRCCGSLIWQRSYYDHIIRDEADYLRTWNYIRTNPDRWLERTEKMTNQRVR